MVFATAVRLLGNPTEAEDIAQTVFMRAFQRFGEIGSSATAAGWLKTVTRNTCLNHLSRYELFGVNRDNYLSRIREGMAYDPRFEQGQMPMQYFIKE